MTLILVVDDEPHITALVTRALRGEGYDTATADDGPVAVERILQGGVDLVVLDVGLPTMDGFEVLRALREAGWPAVISGAGPSILVFDEVDRKTADLLADRGFRALRSGSSSAISCRATIWATCE